MLILKSVWIIFDAAFSAYKLVLHLSATWILFIASSLLHYLPAVLCTNDGWFMLLFLGCYFVETTLCSKAISFPHGSTYCAEAFFLAFSDTFLFFLSHTFSLTFLRLKLSYCSLLRSPDISRKNFSSQFKRSLWNKLSFFISKDI